MSAAHNLQPVTGISYGQPLDERDLEAYEQCGISRETVEAAGLRRVMHLDVASAFGREGVPGDCSGILIPYFWPGESSPRTHRLRRDKPDKNIATGREEAKYIGPPGRAPLLYFGPKVDPVWLQLIALPTILVEGEKKCLAMHELGWDVTGDSAERPAWLAIGIPGVNAWRGTTGRHEGQKAGEWIKDKGMIHDFDRLAWNGRTVIILFDSNVQTRAEVRIARDRLSRELRERGGRILYVDVPRLKDVNGPDDLVGKWGKDRVIHLIRNNAYDPKLRPLWLAGLVRSKDDVPRAILRNCLIALREAPEWHGVLTYDEFSGKVEARKPTPFGFTGPWGDDADARTCEWFQRYGISVGTDVTAQAVQVCAQENAFHPVRDYFSGLKWDGEKRIDTWLSTYFGTTDTDYVRAVARRWLISAVARIYRPGCKADCCLILEGPQGIKKSTGLKALADPWFTDEIAELGSKDAAIQIQGVLVIELAELDQLSRLEASRIKAFMSRTTDRFRPPYGRRLVEASRQCVFAGTVNHSEYLRDETGNRRFWPVRCGPIDLDGLNRDRDQLWAEAKAAFDRGEVWWLDTPELVSLAAEEQADRYECDVWDSTIQQHIATRDDVSVPEILVDCIHKPKELWGRSDEMRVSRVLKSRGWERYYASTENTERRREWRYRRVS